MACPSARTKQDRQGAVDAFRMGILSGDRRVRSLLVATESMATSDAETLLIQRVRSGDAPAWRLLIERYEGRLLAFVDSRLRDRAASEDVVQETFVGFLTSLPHYDEKRDMEAYLFSIAAHKLTDTCASKAPGPSISSAPTTTAARSTRSLAAAAPPAASPAATSAGWPRTAC